MTDRQLEPEEHTDQHTAAEATEQSGPGAPAHAAETAPSPPADEAAALRQELEQLRAELEEQRELAERHLRGWQRSQADFTNYRRRQEQEWQDQIKFAELRLIKDLLPVLDDLDRAWQAVPDAVRDLEWTNGMRLIDQKLRSVLAAHGLKPIEAVGREFDPYSHEAVLREEGEPSELTIVVQELQKGYRVHDRVVRPSLVKVGRAAPASAREGGSSSG